MNTITETPPDFDRLQADSEGRVGELQSRRAGLALDALTDPPPPSGWRRRRPTFPRPRPSWRGSGWPVPRASGGRSPPPRRRKAPRRRPRCNALASFR